MRQHCNQEELEAHRILDASRIGMDIPSTTIWWALWITGDAVGLRNDIDDLAMKPLHLTEPRCAGRDLKSTPTICPVRSQCQRNRQMQIDEDMGLTGHKDIRVMSLPYVPGQACHYRIRIV